MTGADIALISVLGPLGLGLLALIVHVFVEGVEDRLWPRGLRWFPSAWLGASEGLYKTVLRLFWPEKRWAFKGRTLLRLENYDSQWRTWAGTSDLGVPEWRPYPGRNDGRWTPRAKSRPVCPCGYADECAVHCGSGHANGSCPEHEGEWILPLKSGRDPWLWD